MLWAGPREMAAEVADLATRGPKDRREEESGSRASRDCRADQVRDLGVGPATLDALASRDVVCFPAMDDVREPRLERQSHRHCQLPPVILVRLDAIAMLRYPSVGKRYADQDGSLPAGAEEATVEDLQIAGIRFPLDEAKQVVAGYAFATLESTWKPWGGYEVGERPTGRIAKWAYRTYDCVEGSPGAFDDVDILVTVGLNSGIHAKELTALQAVKGELAVALQEIPEKFTFWELPRAHIRKDPKEGPGHWIWRAWWLAMGAVGSGVAVTHKTLHHKRPRVFPLLDNETLKPFRGIVTDAWERVHDDLTGQEASFVELEQWFADLATRLGGVSLTRLRLHDILLWCDCTGNRQVAREDGRPILEANQ